MLLVAATVSIGSGVLGVTPVAGRAVWVALAAGAAATTAAVVAVGVRQWRFVPRRRRTDVAMLVAVGLMLVLAYPPLALAREVWSLGILAASIGTAVTIGWPIARVADAADTRRGVGVP